MWSAAYLGLTFKDLPRDKKKRSIKDGAFPPLSLAQICEPGIPPGLPI